MKFILQNQEDNYIPWNMHLAPKYLIKAPSFCILNLILSSHLVRRIQKVTPMGADPTVKQKLRLFRTVICHKHRYYYSAVILCTILSSDTYIYICSTHHLIYHIGGFAVYNIWKVGIYEVYKRDNYKV